MRTIRSAVRRRLANAAHLTLDLEGNVRFGPDAQWLTPHAVPQEPDAEGYWHDFWERHLYPDATDAWFATMHAAIQQYLPGVHRAGLAPDYTGIRPKLVGPDGGFNDFQVLWHASRDLGLQRVWQHALPDRSGGGGGTLVSLLGIESPGLTSSLALGEHLAEALATHVWGAHNPRSRRAQRYVEQVGHDSLAGWA